MTGRTAWARAHGWDEVRSAGPTDPDEPAWGDTAVRLRGLDAQVSSPFPFVVSDGGKTLLIAEWEWDTNVGVLFGVPYHLSRNDNAVSYREPDGTVNQTIRRTFTLQFTKGGFRVELVMDNDIQDRLAPTLYWPGERPGDNQIDYKAPMDSDELLRFFDQVMGQPIERTSRGPS